MSKRSVDNGQDILDSRDVIARIDELESEISDNADLPEDEQVDMEEEKAELKALQALTEKGEGSADWPHGETLIRDSYFTDYAQDLASDLYGEEIDDAHWPFDCIDWEQAASALQQDYTSVDFDGVTYWIRS